MAVKKRYAFLLDNEVRDCGTAVGQVKARELLRESANLLRDRKGWKIENRKANSVVLRDANGNLRTLSIDSV